MNDDRKQNALLICTGNEFRQDDGVGLFIGRQLKHKGLPGITVIENHGDGMALIEAWKGENMVILVDAVQSGQPAGTIHSFDLLRAPLPEGILHASSHQVGINECITLSRSLGLLPEKLFFYGIEGESFGNGTWLSITVLEAAWKVVESVEKMIVVNN